MPKRLISKTLTYSLLLSALLPVSCTRFVADPDACYNDKVKKLIVNNCATAGCHNPQDKRSGFDFTTYEGVMKAVTAKHSGQSELYTSLSGTGEGRMPPDYSLTKAEKNLIKHWINNGALNNSCTVSTCDSSNFTYSKVSEIVSANCLGCHNKNNVSGGILLDSYVNVVASQNDNNRFLGSIKHDAPYSPMPKFSSQLISCDIRVIEKWVEAGMPNN